MSTNATYTRNAIGNISNGRDVYPQTMTASAIIAQIQTDGGPELSTTELATAMSELVHEKVLRYAEDDGTYTIYWGGAPTR